MSLRRPGFTVAVALILMSSVSAWCQELASRPLRIYTQPPGGGTDYASRLIAPGLATAIGQPVIVENRAGTIAIETVAKAAPDGLSLLLYSGVLWIQPFFKETSWDPVRDFEPITLAVTSPNVLVVHPSLPVKSVKELIALARAHPAQLNYSSAGPGSVPHLSAELFDSMAGIKMTHIPYKGGGPALNDLLAGQVQVLFANSGAASPHIASGRLRALGVTSAGPSALFKGLPPVSQTLPGYESTLMIAIFAPAKTPAATVNRLNQGIVRILKSPDIQQKFLSSGAEVAAGSPSELASAFKTDMARWGKVIREAHIQGE
jgi:tripartite-type tricarboxylate transporter receptor subunit TctC